VSDFNVMVDTKYGKMLVNRKDIYVGTSLRLYGEYCGGEAAFLEIALEPGMVALDLGANVGAHTLVMGRAVGPTGTVMAFEPQPKTFLLLCANVALQSWQHVWPHQMALGKEMGSVNVPLLDSDQENSFSGMTLAEDEPGFIDVPGVPVPMATIDSLDLPRCDFIKADIEGMELEMLQGAEQTIAQHRPLMYLEADKPHRQAELFAWLEAHDYDVWWHRTTYFNPKNYNAVTVDAWTPNMAVIMWVCIPKERKVEMAGDRVHAEELGEDPDALIVKTDRTRFVVDRRVAWFPHLILEGMGFQIAINPSPAYETDVPEGHEPKLVGWNPDVADLTVLRTIEERTAFVKVKYSRKLVEAGEETQLRCLIAGDLQRAFEQLAVAGDDAQR
jgi:FkbM family methyltransferase